MDILIIIQTNTETMVKNKMVGISIYQQEGEY